MNIKNKQAPRESRVQAPPLSIEKPTKLSSYPFFLLFLLFAFIMQIQISY